MVGQWRAVYEEGARLHELGSDDAQAAAAVARRDGSFALGMRRCPRGRGELLLPLHAPAYDAPHEEVDFLILW